MKMYLNIPMILRVLTLYMLMSTTISCGDNLESEWKKTAEKNTIEAYKNFISKFPESEYGQSAERKLDYLEWSKYFDVESEKVLTGTISLLMKSGGFDKNGSMIFHSMLIHKSDSINYQLRITQGTKTIGIDSNTVTNKNSQRISSPLPVSLPSYFDRFPLVFDGKYRMTGFVLNPKIKWEDNFQKVLDSMNVVIDNCLSKKQNIPKDVLFENDRISTIWKLENSISGLGNSKFFVIRKIELLVN